jgi:hypothetical protein
MTAGALQRVIRRAAARVPQPGPSCQLCGLQIPDEHRHMLDTDRNQPLCACRACSVLFNRQAASQGHYQLIPDRRVRLKDVPVKALGVPVGLAFFIPQPDGRVAARYPSPAGATQWEPEPQAWRQVLTACPALASLAPQVEALLVNTARGRSEAWLVPVDDCYRLVAIVRQHWKGLSGGDRVWPEIEQFFAELRRRYGTDPGR